MCSNPTKLIYRLRLTTLQGLLDNESKHKIGVEEVREGDWIVGARVNNIKSLQRGSRGPGWRELMTCRAG